MRPADLITQRDSRTLVLSLRQVMGHAWHGAQYELEDLLGALDDVTLLAPPPLDHPHVRRLVRGVDHLARRRVGLPRHSPLHGEPGAARVTVTGDHDLFFAVFHFADHLSYLRRVEGWRERSRHAVCLLVEQWTTGLPQVADYLEVLRQFDVVYVNNSAVVPALRARGVAAARYLPMAVDAEVLSPLPGLPERVIDVYSYGRRAPAVHAALLDLVERDGLTYLYDTLGNASMRAHAEHRRLLANMMKRARYFVAHRINDSPDRLPITGGEEGLATRYFEAAAGGAVVLGSRPQVPEFDEAFPWPDAVVPLPYSSSDVADLLSDLDRQPDRLAQVRLESVRHSLRHHDWSARWQTVLRDVGLPALPGLDARVQQLSALADGAEEAFQAAGSRPRVSR